MVPRDLQTAVWAYYRPGQEVRKDPTPEYLSAAQAAIDAVAAKEIRTHERDKETGKAYRTVAKAQEVNSEPPSSAKPGDTWGAYRLGLNGWWQLSTPPKS